MFASFIFSLWIGASGAINIPTKEIELGVKMPVVSIGTWTEGTKAADKNVSAIVNNWLDLGGVGIDTAYIYFTQKDIAEVIAQRGADRSKLFITTKFPECLGAAATRYFVNYNLKALNTTYIDLLLIHAPPLQLGCDDTWATLEEYKSKGVLRSIGVSNWSPKHFQQLKHKVLPAVNQIEFSVFSHDVETEKYCAEHNITIMAWSPLADPARSHKSVFSEPNVKAIAAKHNVTPAQVALRWIAQKGHTIALLSSNKDHQANDADIFSFALQDDEMNHLDQIQSQSESIVV